MRHNQSAPARTVAAAGGITPSAAGRAVAGATAGTAPARAALPRHQVSAHGVETSVGMAMGTLRIRMLGPLQLRRGSDALALPGSRKVRALFAYLALSPRALPRSHLCEMLWDAPADPRGELRWCLSKIRAVVDAPGARRLIAEGESLRLDLQGCAVDALAVMQACAGGLEQVEVGELRRLATLLCGGELLQDTPMDAAPLFEAWLTARRRHLHACHIAVLEQLARKSSGGERLACLERWRELAPFDERVHQALLGALAQEGRLAEAEQHLAQTSRLFAQEGLDARPLQQALRVASDAPAPLIAAPQAAPRRAAVAVMPFADHAPQGRLRGGTADALAYDVITRLARLRALFIIAPGTVFALHERGIGPEEAARMLGVDYIVSGAVRTRGTRLRVSAELVEARGARIVWSETYDHPPGDALRVLEEIGDRIVASVAAEIETRERNLALLKPPESLDAWEAYHRGLWHMYRYRKPDNDSARCFFERALKLDPGFSRAYAGLSFTHFQDAFQNWEARSPHLEAAYAAAAQGLLADERDPAVHWAMGRALWLRRNWEASEASLSRSVELSPNFALGHYNLSFLRSVVGDPRVAIGDADLSRRLSPYDPMLFGMLATPAMALVRLRRFEEAADWAVKAAARPNAFPHIHAIAAYALALAGRVAEGRVYAAAARQVSPGYDIERFLFTFPFEPQGEALFRRGARLIDSA